MTDDFARDCVVRLASSPLLPESDSLLAISPVPLNGVRLMQTAQPLFSSPVGRLRFVAMCEAVSFLILLFIAMPLKKWAGLPGAVRWVGWIHGILFLLFCLALLLAAHSARWKFSKTALVFVAGLIPFGPFLIDRRLRHG